MTPDRIAAWVAMDRRERIETPLTSLADLVQAYLDAKAAFDRLGDTEDAALIGDLAEAMELAEEALHRATERDYRRLVDALHHLGAQHRTRPDWQRRVFARIEANRRRSWVARLWRRLTGDRS